MNAIILCIGDEILIGQVVNTNAAWLGDELTRHGVQVLRTVVCADRRRGIAEEIRHAAEQADVVVVTGGLGPTDDDLTKDAVCDLLHCKMQLDKQQLQRIEDRFTERGIMMNDRSRSQAFVPAAVRVLPNHYGNAPGFRFTFSRAVVYILPGVPDEMQGIFTDLIAPELATANDAIIRQSFVTYGIAESLLADKLGSVYPLLDGNVTLAFLPSDGVLRLRLMCLVNHPDARDRFSQALAIIRVAASDWIISDVDEPIAGILGRTLKEHNLTISLAESCTAGLLGYSLTTIPGSSDYFLGGITAYSYQAKMDLLGVPREMLEQFGAVSREVCEAMAIGVRRKFSSDVAISITGIAGPGGGLPGKPVGTVWIGVCTIDGISAVRFRLGSDREVIRRRTVSTAIVFALKKILSK